MTNRKPAQTGYLHSAFNPVLAVTMLDLTGNIIAYECGQLDDEQTIGLFAELVRNGMAWKLQGHYGRVAVILIKDGYIDENGNILTTLSEEYR